MLTVKYPLFLGLPSDSQFVSEMRPGAFVNLMTVLDNAILALIVALFSAFYDNLISFNLS